MIQKIYCCACNLEVQARLTSGEEIYPHRDDLKDLPFWVCDECHNYVGCHYKTEDSTKPLGCIPSVEIRIARQNLHTLIDPLWKSRRLSRKEVYKAISAELGYEYHTAEVKNLSEVAEVQKALIKIQNDYNFRQSSNTRWQVPNSKP